jgi:hypothetical protein
MPYDAGPPTAAEFDRGVHHMQMMGVKYYMAIDARTQALAARQASLREIAASGPWRIYEVASAPVVQGLANEPAVLTGQPTTGEPWQDVAVCWWHTPDSWEVPLTADGPPGWQRVARTHEPAPDATPSEKCEPTEDWGWFAEGGGPEAKAQPPVTVTNVDIREDGVSFDVDRPGVPVMVKVSYFPNWKVSGAQGPFRATPNFMVVVPDGNHVELRYGWTALDIAAYLVSLLGLAGLVVLFRARPVRVGPPGPFWGRAERPDLYPPAAPVPYDEGSWTIEPDRPPPADLPGFPGSGEGWPSTPDAGPPSWADGSPSPFAPPDGHPAVAGPSAPPSGGGPDEEPAADVPGPPAGADTVAPMGEHPHASVTIDPPPPPPDDTPGPERAGA